MKLSISKRAGFVFGFAILLSFPHASEARENLGGCTIAIVGPTATEDTITLAPTLIARNGIVVNSNNPAQVIVSSSRLYVEVQSHRENNWISVGARSLRNRYLEGSVQDEIADRAEELKEILPAIALACRYSTPAAQALTATILVKYAGRRVPSHDAYRWILELDLPVARQHCERIGFPNYVSQTRSNSLGGNWIHCRK